MKTLGMIHVGTEIRTDEYWKQGRMIIRPYRTHVGTQYLASMRTRKTDYGQSTYTHETRTDEYWKQGRMIIRPYRIHVGTQYLASMRTRKTDYRQKI